MAPITIPHATALLQGSELACFPRLWKAPGFNLAAPAQHHQRGLARHAPELAPHGLSRGSGRTPRKALYRDLLAVLPAFPLPRAPWPQPTALPHTRTAGRFCSPRVSYFLG